MLAPPAVHLIGQAVVHEHVEQIDEYAGAVALHLPLLTAEYIAELQRGGAGLSLDAKVLIFWRGDKMFRGHPGDVQPPATAIDIEVDGETIRFWRAVPWRCSQCRRLFYVSAKSQLLHYPCCDGADW